MAGRRPRQVVEARLAEARDRLVDALDAYLAEVLAQHQAPPLVLTVAQAADLLDCHPSKVYHLIEQGLLTPLDGWKETRLSGAQVRAFANGEPAPVGLRAVGQ